MTCPVCRAWECAFSADPLVPPTGSGSAEYPQTHDDRNTQNSDGIGPNPMHAA